MPIHFRRWAIFFNSFCASHMRKPRLLSWLWSPFLAALIAPGRSARRSLSLSVQISPMIRFSLLLVVPPGLDSNNQLSFVESRYLQKGEELSPLPSPSCLPFA